MQDTHLYNNTKKNSTIKNFVHRMILLLMGGSFCIFSFNSSWQYHIILRVAYVMFVVIMGIEMHYLFSPENRPRSIIISIYATLIFPAFSFILPHLSYTFTIEPYVAIFLLFILYTTLSFFKNWNMIIRELHIITFLILYPGLLASFFLHIAEFEFATIHYYTLVGTTYTSDGLGYLVGISIGRIEKKYRKKPLLSVSPNKTCTGYIGGILFGMIPCVITYVVNPEAFAYSLPKALLLGFIVNIASMYGDLFESILKRHLNKKDSGNFMLGRGGVLDTFDSLLFASTAYYITYQLLF